MEKESFLDFENIDAANLMNFTTGAPCILGIDETGRGPVLGPMVYGCAIVFADKKEELKSLGAASIFAKVTRDRRVSNLQDSTSEIGSGYPSDPTTKCYISKNLNPLFGFPSLVRFSWQTIEKLIGAGAVKCLWNIQGTDDCLKQYTLVDIWTASKKVERKDEREQHLKHTTKLIRHRFFAERNIANMDVFE
uniref:Ribonuclease n=1 Tax=Meloidogyne hapla TaxID=6305 RepID=A0A1I8AYW3_MELHA